ncbi:hypothetical protein D3C76_1241600 [compost metagenome]
MTAKGRVVAAVTVACMILAGHRVAAHAIVATDQALQCRTFAKRQQGGHLQLVVVDLADDTQLRVVDQPAHLAVVVLRQAGRNAGMTGGLASLVETRLADQFCAVVSQLDAGLVLFVVLRRQTLHAVVFVAGEQSAVAVPDAAELAGRIVGQRPLRAVRLQ